MTSQTIYAYTNIQRDTTMVAEDELNMTGTWASTGTYWADPKDTVQYGNALYVALVDNINVVPTFVPKKGQRKWSELAIIRQGTNFNEHTIDEAYELAEQAMAISVDGTNSADYAGSLAYTALQTAWSGTAAAALAAAAAVVASNQAGQAQTTADYAATIAIAGTNAAAAAQASANQAQATANTALTTAWAGTAASEANAHEGVGFSFVIDGAGAEILQGFKGNVEIPFAMRINEWTIVADQAGSCVVDLAKSNGYAGFPTQVSITANDKPTLDNAQKNRNTNPDTWDRSLAKGDIVGYTVLGAGTVQSVTVALSGTRS